jgi:hypothetical protein
MLDEANEREKAIDLYDRVIDRGISGKEIHFPLDRSRHGKISS